MDNIKFQKSLEGINLKIYIGKRLNFKVKCYKKIVRIFKFNEGIIPNRLKEIYSPLNKEQATILALYLTYFYHK